MIEFTQKLQNIGLTEREARVYLFLLEYQEARTGLMCSKLNIPNSHIYRILEKLLDKGIISFKIVNNIKVFRPVDPESLYALFREKERQLEQEKQELKGFISSLKKIELKDKKQNDFKYFEGINGVRSMFTEFINSWTPNSEVYIASAPIAYEKWNAFLLDLFHPPRIKNNIHQQLIIPKSLKKHALEREKFQPIDIRYSDEEMKSEFGVAGDYTYFLSYGEKPYALLIKDRNFADTQKNIFQIMWEKARPE
jgi:sugar-specific transcriptional regulator TrmB